MNVKGLPLWEKLSFSSKFFKKIRDNHKLSFLSQTYVLMLAYTHSRLQVL